MQSSYICSCCRLFLTAVCFGLARECVLTLFFQLRALCVRSMIEPSQEDIGNQFGYQKEERCASLCSCVLTRSSLQICPLYFTDRKNPELLPNILSTCLFKKNTKKTLARSLSFLFFLLFCTVKSYAFAHAQLFLIKNPKTRKQHLMCIVYPGWVLASDWLAGVN